MITFPAQQQLIAMLLDPRRYLHGVRKVRLIETHISWVLLAGRYAYKIKKALDLGFLDFTGLESRRFYCAEELRLNRRFAPRIYLDVVPIGGNPDDPVFGTQPVIEYAVRMRRFASNKIMDKLLAQGRVTPQHMDDLAATLACFHASLLPAAPDSAYGTAVTIRAAALQNFEQLQPLLKNAEDQEKLSALGQLITTAYNLCEDIFGDRRKQGFVRECHGDLHLGNIVLIDSKPVPFDGIEFNPALRWLDVMDEVAFPVMDLLHRNQASLAFRFLNTYLEASGDYAGISVLRFYLAYRAMVRAKVSAIRACQPGSAKQAISDGMLACRSYLALAGRCLTQRQPALIITHGLPGSGKSTFAQMVVERFGAIRIRSDVERKRLYGLSALTSSNSNKDVDIYSRDATLRTYARLHELARNILAAGFPVIVDAAFLMHDEREHFRKLAQRMAVPFAIVSLSAPDSKLNTRLAQRRRSARDASEADGKVMQMLQSVQEPLTAQEQMLRAEFVNGETTASLAAAPGWGQLQDMLARPSRK